MKALTNILTQLLMLMLLLLVACTEETAEVDNLTRGEQYVQVRMQVPGMTAAATRAADGEITSITALAFDSDGGFLKKITINTVTNTNENGGYNGTFNLAVPNGTKNIHFLANLPNNYDLSGVKNVEDLTSLTTTDYNNLVYWGMATYDGNNSTLSTTLYRNMAKISIKPSVEDAEFNQFTQEQLIIMGLDNPNTSGTLVPYNNGFHNTGVAPTYLTLPNGVTTLDKTPVGNEGAGYGYSLYVFEHANSNYLEQGLFVICKIGDDFYKVALTRDGINPYQIIRNHEYIIYVSDVDDYAHDNNYRASNYDDALGKKPINLAVKEVAQVVFNANTTNIDVDGNLTVTMTVPEEGTVTALTISAPGFTIKQGETTLGADGSYIGNGLNIAGNSTVTYTFVPNTFGKGKAITFTASGTNLQKITSNINVDVNAAISASPTVNNPTLYYDQDNQTVTVNVTMPKGLSAISIGGAGNFTVSQSGNAMTIDNGVYTYTRNDATATQEVQFVFTLDKSKYTSQQGNTSAAFTFSDASTMNAADKATPVSVNNISLIPTPVVTFTYADNPTLNMNNNETYTVTMNVPNVGTLTALNIAAEGFTVASSSGGLNGPVDNVYSYTGGTTIFTFTPTSAGSRTIRFYSGEGVNINVPEKNISVTVNAAITATATPSTIYHDSNDKTVTVSVTIPKGVSGLNISATDFSYGDDTDGLYTYNRADATTQEQVDFVFTLKDGVTEDSSITFSDASSNANVSSATVNINVEATPVVTNALTVTPITSTVIDLNASGNKTVQLRLAIPTDLAYMRIHTNYAFTVSALNGYKQPRSEAPNYYYDYIEPGSVNTIDLEFTMVTDKIFEVAGEYPITFYTAHDSSEGVSTTITVLNEDLDADVIWEGSKVMNHSPGHILYYTSFKDYRDSGKILKIDLTPTGDGWKQFFIKYEGNNNETNLASFTGNDLPSTFSIDIPSEDRDLNIYGSNVTITKIYIGEGD